MIKIINICYIFNGLKKEECFKLSSINLCILQFTKCLFAIITIVFIHQSLSTDNLVLPQVCAK